MATSQPTNWNRIIRQAILAGAIGAICIDAFLYVAMVAPAHGNITDMWQSAAANAFGKTAYTSPAFIWIGLVIHLIVSMAWAGGYVYLAATRPFMNERWPLSGVVYGFVVMVFMVLLQLGAREFAWPGERGWLLLFLAYTVFFGLPVAFTVSRLDRV